MRDAAVCLAAERESLAGAQGFLAVGRAPMAKRDVPAAYGAAASRMLRTIAGSVAIPRTPLTMNWMPMQRRRNPITFVRAFIPDRPITATIEPESRSVP